VMAGHAESEYVWSALNLLAARPFEKPERSPG
jgi:hypothetical protein